MPITAEEMRKLTLGTREQVMRFYRALLPYQIVYTSQVEASKLVGAVTVNAEGLAVLLESAKNSPTFSTLVADRMAEFDKALAIIAANADKLDEHADKMMEIRVLEKLHEKPNESDT